MYSTFMDYQPEDAPDAPTVLSERTPVARKAHTCDTCDGPIHAGTRYRVTALIDEDGDFQSYKAHRACCQEGAEPVTGADIERWNQRDDPAFLPEAA